jgi:hypothetical protein
VGKDSVFWANGKRFCKLFGISGFLRKYKSGNWLKIIADSLNEFCGVRGMFYLCAQKQKIDS